MQRAGQLRSEGKGGEGVVATEKHSTKRSAQGWEFFKLIFLNLSRKRFKEVTFNENWWSPGRRHELLGKRDLNTERLKLQNLRIKLKKRQPSIRIIRSSWLTYLYKYKYLGQKKIFKNLVLRSVAQWRKRTFFFF